MHLVLFFTRGVSLQVWDEVGMFEREVALYKRLQSLGITVTFVTYGHAAEYKFSNRIPGINICCNRWSLPAKLYQKLIPVLHRRQLATADIIKTNQTNGAELALTSANYYKKPLIARCGYMWSKNAIIEHGEYSNIAVLSQKIEAMVFSQAQRIVVTTGEMQENVHQRFPATVGSTTVIPNYVNTALFRRGEKEQRNRLRLCFVGRLAPEKNLEILLDAIDGLDVELDIIGEGPQRSFLEFKARNNGGVRFHGRVPNEQLPNYFHRSSAFVFPSLYEGHPKTPIEAMACGLPVIGCDVSGVREIVTHKQTGWLCEPNAQAIADGIRIVLGDEKFCRQLGEQARQFVVAKYSLDRVVVKEFQMYREIMKDCKHDLARKECSTR